MTLGQYAIHDHGFCWTVERWNPRTSAITFYDTKHWWSIPYALYKVWRNK